MMEEEYRFEFVVHGVRSTFSAKKLTMGYYVKHTFQIDPTKSEITFGRRPTNDLIVGEDVFSREHGKLIVTNDGENVQFQLDVTTATNKFFVFEAPKTFTKIPHIFQVIIGKKYYIVTDHGLAAMAVSIERYPSTS